MCVWGGALVLLLFLFPESWRRSAFTVAVVLNKESKQREEASKGRKQRKKGRKGGRKEARVLCCVVFCVVLAQFLLATDDS